MENKEMTTRERTATGLGLAFGSAGLVIITDIILSKMKVTKFPMVGNLSILILGGVIGGFYGNKLGKKWQANSDKNK